MKLLVVSTMVADFIATSVTFIIANSVSGSDPTVLASPVLASLGTSLLALLFLNFGRAYNNDALFINVAGDLLIAWIGVVIVILFLLFITKTSVYFSRLAVVFFFSIGIIWIFLNHLISTIMYNRLRKMGVFARRIIVIGTSKEIRSLKIHVDAFEEVDFEVIEYLTIKADWSPTKLNISKIERLVRSRNASDIREIVIAMDWHAPGFRQLLKKLREYPYSLKLFPSEVVTDSPDFAEVSVFLGRPVLGIEKRPLSTTNLFFKAVEDYVLSLTFLIIGLPLFAAVSLIIRLEGPGPIIFRQSRYGYNGCEFKIFKFRTMVHVVNAVDTAKQATKDDPRITRVGKFLRVTSLDEIPQLLNVLRGEMSLVGPRPHPIAFDKEVQDTIPGYIARQKTKPGITGWAQINGLRGETSDV